jgi:beta-xylosidase
VLRSVRRLTKPGWIVLCVIVVAAEMVVGDAHIASAGIGIEDLTPPPALTPLTPARIILKGPDATDPFMLHVGKLYYLYTSEGDFGASAYDMNVPVWIGTRIGHWRAPRDVLPVLPAWANWGATWAPDVRKVAGGWALYFSAVLKGVHPETHCIGAAFGPGPAGPFTAEAQPMICQRDHRGSIDARTFLDADDKLVMYWKSEDNANPDYPGPDQNGRTGIWAQGLSANGRVLLGSPVKIFQPDQPWEGTIAEAPDVIEVFGTYWLFFSANWYNTAGYAIGVASCQTAFGPCTDPVPQPLLGSNSQGSGPGEPSVYNDGHNIYLLYNPWHSNDPAPTPPRPVAMARIGFRSNGPYLATP